MLALGAHKHGSSCRSRLPSWPVFSPLGLFSLVAPHGWHLFKGLCWFPLEQTSATATVIPVVGRHDTLRLQG